MSSQLDLFNQAAPPEQKPEEADAIQIRSPTPEDNSGRSLGQLSPSQKAMADKIREMSKQLKFKKSPPDNQK